MALMMAIPSHNHSLAYDVTACVPVWATRLVEQARLRACLLAGGIVSAMQSVEGENVKFKSPVATAAAKGKVEQWLLEVS